MNHCPRRWTSLFRRRQRRSETLSLNSFDRSGEAGKLLPNARAHGYIAITMAHSIRCAPSKLHGLGCISSPSQYRSHWFWAPQGSVRTFTHVWLLLVLLGFGSLDAAYIFDCAIIIVYLIPYAWDIRQHETWYLVQTKSEIGQDFDMELFT